MEKTILRKAVHIHWDIDDPSDLEFLPTEILIPETCETDDDISNYISQQTGFCHTGYQIETYKPKNQDEWYVYELKNGPTSICTLVTTAVPSEFEQILCSTKQLRDLREFIQNLKKAGYRIISKTRVYDLTSVKKQHMQSSSGT